MSKKVIRLYKVGCYKYAVFYIVVGHKSSFRGNFEKIGFFNPHNSENYFFLNFSRLGFWLNHGAKIKPSVYRLIGKFLAIK
jgi:ribosomal protein S16